MRLAVLAFAVVLAACEATTGPTPQPTGGAPTAGPLESDAPSTSAGPTASAPASPSSTPAPSGPPSTLSAVTPGALAVTVTDRLRVRSEPRVADDSLKYTPVLPKGTQLVVAAGPVEASGYTWFRVAPVGVTLDDGVDQGWVAVADHDGTPWVAVADDPTPGFELAAVTADPIDPTLAAAKAQAAATNRFGLALYRRLRATGDLEGKGIVFSPYSIETALAMARAGARGRTAAEMDTVLRVADWSALARGTASLADVLARRDGAWTVQGDGETGTHYLALRVANMAFAQRGFPLQEAYLARISSTFRSGFGLVDYERDPAAARDAINGWVSRQTLGRIPSLLQPPDVTSATRLVLVNAVYFKGEWLVPFRDGDTQPATFTTPSGAKQVPTMDAWGEQSIPYLRGTGYRATELRYQGPDTTHPLAMTIVMPDDFAAFDKAVTPSKLQGITDGLAAQYRALQVITDSTEEDGCPTYPYATRLFLPKFGIDTRADLVPVLEALGMRDAFDPALADFSGMSASEPLHVGMVVHQANIDVDERGTEAAAATAVGMDTGGCTGPVPVKEKVLKVNRPFLFFVRDLQTGAILFMGRVLDPTAR